MHGLSIESKYWSPALVKDSKNTRRRTTLKNQMSEGISTYGWPSIDINIIWESLIKKREMVTRSQG